MIYHVCRVPQNSDLREGTLFFCVCVLEETYIQYDMTGTRLIYHVPVTVIQVLLSASVCGNKGQEAYCLNLCPQFFTITCVAIRGVLMADCSNLS